MLRKALNYIANHFLLRNLIFAICGILVVLFITNLLLGLFTRHGERLFVPDMQGQTVSQAQIAAQKDKLQIVVVDSLYVSGQAPGVILDQNPKPEMTVKSGRKIFVVINSERPRMEFIPYVAGYSLRQAKNLIENQGFQIEKILYRSDVATNNVLGESYKGKPITAPNQVKAVLGEGVVLTVGRNSESPLPQVPKTVGLTLREAKSRLWEMGLNIGDIRVDSGVNKDEMEKARVYKQVPNQQARADYGSSVMLYVTNDATKVSQGNKDSDSEARKFVDIDQLEEDILKAE